MKLSQPVVLQAYAFTDPVTNKRVEPVPFMMDTLDVNYVINNSKKMIYAQIVNIPQSIILFANNTFPEDLSSFSLASLDIALLERLGSDPKVTLQSLFPKTIEADPNGPGTILSGLISAMGIKVNAGCGCKRHAIEMNEKGNDWCEQNLDTITGWLKEESNKRKLPFIETLAKMVVKRAIKMSRKLKAKEQQ
jgi:hypothetical protein